VIVSSFLYILSSSSIFSAENILFYDNFDDSRENWTEMNDFDGVEDVGWEIVNDGFGNGIYKTTFKGIEELSLVVSDTDSLSWEDYVVTAKFLSKSGVDQYLYFRSSPSDKSYYMVDFRASGWTDSNNIRIIKKIGGERKWLHQINPPDIGCDISNDTWYDLKVSVSGNSISVEIKCPGDGSFNNIFSFIDEESPLLSGGIGLAAWSGSWSDVVEKHFDEIKVVSSSEISTQNPLIFIPGLGGSWNTQAMIYDQNVDPSSWQMTPFVDVYDLFEATAVANGYEEGVDFFVWNYDWRQPVPEIKSDLDSFINSTPNLSSAENIDLVGHSLGGVVSRAWASENSSSGKVISLGSPHKGAVLAYEALAGGLVVNPGLERFALKLFLSSKKKSVETDAETIRSFAPVVLDLLPIFNFAQEDGQMIDYSEMSFVNNFLSLIDQQTDNDYFLIGNSGLNTKKELILGKRSVIDKILNLWPDGKPSGSVLRDGDETVLTNSAYLENYEEEFNLNHGDLIKNFESIKKIFSLLGKEDVVVSDVATTEELLVFYLASPATLTVNGSSPENSDLQFVIFPDYLDQDYSVEITGTGTGEYQLFVGQSTSSGDFWHSYSGMIESGGKDNFVFRPDKTNNQNDPLFDPNGKSFLIQAKDRVYWLNKGKSNIYLRLAERFLLRAISKVEKSKEVKAIVDIKNSLRMISLYRGLVGAPLEDFNESEAISRLIVNGWANIIKKNDLSSEEKVLQVLSRAEKIFSRMEKILEKVKNEPKALSLYKSSILIDETKLAIESGDFAIAETKGHLAYLFAWESMFRR